MKTYDHLCEECRSEGIELLEADITCKGLYGDNLIAISTRIDTTTEKKCILAEEIGHHMTTYGVILDQNNTNNVKQELRARGWAFEKLIPLRHFIQAFEHRCLHRQDLLDYLDVTDEFLDEALTYYKRKNGLYARVNDYIITFEPFGVMKHMDKNALV